MFSLKAIRTVKLKVKTEARIPEREWLAACNWLSKIVFETKNTSPNSLHKAHYGQVREKFGLGSQLTCSLFRSVTTTYKTAKALGRWNLAGFKKASIPVCLGRDFSRTKASPKLWGSKMVLVGNVPDGAWCDSKLKRVGNTWYLLLSHEVEVPAVKTTGSVVGVDMGVKRMLVATNCSNSKTFFFHGGALNARRTQIRETRSAVQAVGSRSAKRLLKRLSGKEAAVTDCLLHIASKALVRYAVENGARKIVMEDLTNIRDSSLSKGKDLRSKVARWPYAKARFFIEYKAQAVGISTEVVSPKNTSRGCNCCGYVSASNRNGLLFLCKKCGHREDADRHASKNIRARSISIEHNSAETGSDQPPIALGSSEIRHCGDEFRAAGKPRLSRRGS